MKRILKWSLILGSICCVTGIGTITAGAVMGGGTHLEKGLRRVTAEGREQLRNQIAGDLTDDLRETLAAAIGTDKTETDKTETGKTSKEETTAGAGTDYAPMVSEKTYTGVRRLDIEMMFNQVELREWDGEDKDSIVIDCEESAETAYKIRQEGNKLELKVDEKDRKLFSGDKGMESLIIYVPRGYVFDEVEIENDMGSFLADTINARKLSLECSAGEIVINGGTVNNLDAECEAGSITCLAAVDTGADVECDTGAAVITLAGSLENYDYSLECSIGEILLGGEEMHQYSGLNKKHHLDHHAGRSVKLECQAGSIKVNFSKPAV